MRAHWILALILGASCPCFASPPASQPTEFSADAVKAAHEKMMERHRSAAAAGPSIEELHRQIATLRLENGRLIRELNAARSQLETALHDEKPLNVTVSSPPPTSQPGYAVSSDPTEREVNSSLRKIEKAVERHVTPELERQGERLAEMTQRKVESRMRSDMSASEMERMMKDIAAEMESEYERAAKDLEPSYDRAAREAFDE